MYVPPGIEEKVADHMNIYLNSQLLQKMYAIWSNIPDAIDSADLQAKIASEFVSFLSVKIFHGTNHLLLTIVDDMDFSMNLLAEMEDRYAYMLPKECFGSIYHNFGNLMERACFGGILLLECWESNNYSQNVLSSKTETFRALTVVPSIASIGLGKLDYVVPTEAAQPTWKRSRSTSRLAKTHGQNEDGISKEESGEEGEIAEQDELEDDEFLPVHMWPSAKRVATARP